MLEEEHFSPRSKKVFIVTNSKKISSIISKFGGNYFISKKT